MSLKGIFAKGVFLTMFTFESRIVEGVEWVRTQKGFNLIRHAKLGESKPQFLTTPELG